MIPGWILRSKSYSLAVTDLEGKYIFVNEVFEQRFSFLAGSLEGLPFRMSIHPDDAEKCTAAAYECMSNPQAVVEVQMRKPGKEGDFYWTNWEFSLFRDKHNQPAGLLCLGQDITEAKKVGQQAKKSESKLRAILDSTTDSNVLVGADFRILSFNKAANEIAKAIHGKTLCEGCDFRNFLPEGSEKDFRHCFGKALAGETSMMERMRLVGNEHVWFQVKYFPVREGGSIVGVSINTSNISEKVNAQNRLKQSEYMLSAIYNSTSEASTFIDLDFKILYSNNVAKADRKSVV